MSIKDITYDAELDALIFSPRRSDQKSFIIPLRSQTAFTKIVGSSSIGGSFPTLQKAFDASVAGDSILVTKGYSISALETCPVNNVHIQFQPGVYIDASGITGAYALRLAGNSITVERSVYFFGGNTVTGCIQIAGNDCEVTRASVQMLGSTLTNAYAIEAAASRTYLIGSVQRVSGTLTNLLLNLGTDSDASVRGG